VRLLLVGIVGASAQCGIAQTAEPRLCALPADDAAVRARFAELLVEAPTRDLRAGWQLARDLGPAVGPALFALASGEKSNMKRRMSAFCAAALAEGPQGDDRLFAVLDDRAPLQDRLCASLLIALGPMRSRPQPDFWSRALGRNRQEPIPALLVAALLASSRFPMAGAACPQPALRVDNPGVLAAALLAGAQVSESLVAPYLRPRGPAHSNLVQRAWLLRGALQRAEAAPSSAMVDRARELLASPGESNATLRDAAALMLGAADAVRADGQSRPEWRLLQMHAMDARAAVALQSWLQAQPQPLDEPAWPRLSVAYALGRPIDRVVADRAAWGGVAAVRSHVALALAMRVCAESRPEPIEASMPELPEWAFVRWASGAAFPQGVRLSDPILQQAASMAQEDRLPRESARRLFEDTLWRWGSHPGLALWSAQRDLVRDLLLAGSLPGNRYAIGLPDHLRYLPAGLGNENDFFGIAVEAWEFLKTPTLPIPAECRLR